MAVGHIESLMSEQMPVVLTDAKRAAADRKAKARASERDMKPPAIVDVAARMQREADDVQWLKHYMGHIYRNPLSDDRLENIRQIRYCAEYGVRKCIAAPRGSGKTTDFRYLLLKDALAGVLPFAYLVSGSGSKAQESEDALRDTMESAMPGSPLFDDYPFQCTVIQSIARAPSSQHNATVWGMKLHCRWAKNAAIVFPSIRDPDADSDMLWEKYRIKPNQLGSILASCGITSSMLQGSNVLNVRPSLIGIDDVDDRESTDIETGTMAGKIEKIIDKTIAGMSGQGSKPMGQVMLCTVPSDNSVAFLYSDPQSKPAWDGVRIARLKTWPKRMHLWDKYVEMKTEGLQKLDADKRPVDKFGRNAYQFYIDHREEMDEGSSVYDECDFNATPMPDGTPMQASAVQACFDYIAEVGRESFDTEHQQDPPPRADILETRVTGYHVADSAGELVRGLLDPSTMMVCRGIDVRRIELHQVAVSTEHAINHRIPDYSLRTHGNSETTVELAEQAILEGLRNMAQEWHENPLTDLNGMAHETDLTLIDKGWVGNWTEDGTAKSWVTQPVETFCIEQGLRRWLPAKGSGTYRIPKPSREVIIGDNWHINRGEGAERSCDEVIWNAHHWHLLVEELFTIEPDHPDRFELFAPDDTDRIYARHRAFARHIIKGADTLKQQLSKGTRSRKPRFAHDHWWDSLAMALVAKSIENTIREKQRTRKKKLSLADMQQAAR